MTIEITEQQFIDRFVAHCLNTCGFTHFDDGGSVEACAESDMDYWGEG